MGAVHDSFFYQVNDAFREHFSVHTQVLVIVEVAQYGIGDSSDSHLQRGAIFDDFCNVFSDLNFRFCRIDQFHFLEILIHENTGVEIIEVNDPVSQGSGHLIVDLGDNLLAFLDGCHNNVDRYSKRAKSMSVRG